jgi:glucose-1-phosphate adenylyltransferase
MIFDDYILSFIMAGGRGSRLEVLTRDRGKPAVNILGHYRIFDFVATNVAGSGIPAILIATQFEPKSLTRHIGNGQIWGFDGIDKMLEIAHPYEEGRSFVTFEGTADSVRKTADRIDRYNPGIVLVLGGDHIYSMDYSDAIVQHKMNAADITIMTNAIPDSKVSDFGIVKIDESGRIVEFAEKPTDKEVIKSFRLTARTKERLGVGDPDLNFLASMGNYVFFWDKLKRFLDFPGVDFGKDIIPAIKENNGDLYAYVFDGFWRDVGKVRDYFSCNMEFVNGDPPMDLLQYQIRTPERYLPSAWIASDVSIKGAILSPGDVIHKGITIKNSVLGYQTIIEEGCTLDRCLLLGADKDEFHHNRIRKEYTMHIGKGSSLSYVILDKNVWVGEGVDIGPHNGTPEKREEMLKSIGLKPYIEHDDGKTEGDFCIEPETGILVIGRQQDADPKKPILPDGLRC